MTDKVFGDAVEAIGVARQSAVSAGCRGRAAKPWIEGAVVDGDEHVVARDAGSGVGARPVHGEAGGALQRRQRGDAALGRSLVNEVEPNRRQYRWVQVEGDARVGADDIVGDEAG